MTLYFLAFICSLLHLKEGDMEHYALYTYILLVIETLFHFDNFPIPFFRKSFTFF